MAELKCLLTLNDNEADPTTANMPSIIDAEDMDINVEWDNLTY